MWRNEREEQRQKCGWKIQPCSSVGGLYRSDALSEESSGDKQRWGGKGGDEGTRDTRGNIRESEHDKNNERKREGQGQPEAVFPPRSLSGSGVTRKLARLHTLHAAKHTRIKTPPTPPQTAFL